MEKHFIIVHFCLSHPRSSTLNPSLMVCQSLVSDSLQCTVTTLVKGLLESKQHQQPLYLQITQTAPSSSLGSGSQLVSVFICSQYITFASFTDSPSVPF